MGGPRRQRWAGSRWQSFARTADQSQGVFGALAENDGLEIRRNASNGCSFELRTRPVEEYVASGGPQFVTTGDEPPTFTLSVSLPGNPREHNEPSAVWVLPGHGLRLHWQSGVSAGCSGGRSMTAKPTEESPARGAGAGLVRDDEEAQRSSDEAELGAPDDSEPAPPDDAGGSRTADVLAYMGGALVLFGLLALTFTWLTSLWGIVALLGIGGAMALALCWATRRLRPAAVSDVLAGIAAISLTLCVDTVFDASGLVVGPDERWILVCVPAMLLGGAICWWFRSRAAGSWAAAGFVALPLALATGSEERLGFTLPLSVTVPTVSVWVTLVLMVVAVTLVEQAARVAARRGLVVPATVAWIVFVASSTLGTVLVISARVQGESWFYFVLVAAAAAVTGLAIWGREWVLLSTASRLFFAAGVTVFGGIDDGPGQAMGLVVLSLSCCTFAPFVQRLPNHFSVRGWLRMIWFTGFCASCAFAFAPGVWPAAGGLWAAGVLVLAAVQRRVLAMVLAALALFFVFLVTVIEMFGAITGTGFGTIFFGITLLGVVVAWRERVEVEPAALEPSL
ncbi:hypothetical protein [Candidatus Poriferisodalis sp.]|uniref:hypothetical protein n=1 Tax=Candidatus Poriferisodalis sp. TaxID=3101277 RepID=UPI003C6FD775